MGAPKNKGRGKSIAFLLGLVGHDGEACVTWPFSRSAGYGTLGYLGVNHWAHRLMCELTHGPAPSERHEASHSCGRGNQGCVNPKHLEWKTASDNQLDRARHGTKNVWGGRGKISPEQAAEIKALAGIKTQDEIAATYGISRSRVSGIINKPPAKRIPHGTRRSGKRWVARLKDGGKYHHLGTFSSKDEATRAYQEAVSRIRATAT